MQRFPPFDPPEYVSWKPDPALVRAYRATIEADPERAAVVSGLSADGQLALYAGLLRAHLATDDSPSRGRDLHVGAWTHGVLQPISHVGDMVPVVMGVALTFKMRGERRVALTWVGDGSTKTAAAHEATNFAAVQRVPAIFILQNNQVALGTRLDQHHLPGDFREWPAQYGVWGAQFDGNNVLDAYAAARLAAARCRDGQGPAMLVAETFRMGGHATHDEREARETLPAEMFQAWGKRDPVGLYEEYLKEEGRTAQQLGEVEAAVTAQVERAAEEALASREKMPPGESAVVGVYAKQGRQ